MEAWRPWESGWVLGGIPMQIPSPFGSIMKRVVEGQGRGIRSPPRLPHQPLGHHVLNPDVPGSVTPQPLAKTSLFVLRASMASCLQARL